MSPDDEMNIHKYEGTYQEKKCNNSIYQMLVKE